MPQKDLLILGTCFLFLITDFYTRLKEYQRVAKTAYSNSSPHPTPICFPSTGVFSSLGILALFQLKVPDFLATSEDIMIQAGQQCETKTTDPSDIINPTFSLQVCFKILSLPCPCPSPFRPFVHLPIKEDKSGNSLMGVL